MPASLEDQVEARRLPLDSGSIPGPSGFQSPERCYPRRRALALGFTWRRATRAPEASSPFPSFPCVPWRASPRPVGPYWNDVTPVAGFAPERRSSADRQGSARVRRETSLNRARIPKIKVTPVRKKKKEKPESFFFSNFKVVRRLFLEGNFPQYTKAKRGFEPL